MSRRLTQQQKDYMIGTVEDELNSLSDDEYESYRRSESSFMRWVEAVAYRIGRLASAPFRAIFKFIKGFFDGFFD